MAMIPSMRNLRKGGQSATTTKTLVAGFGRRGQESRVIVGAAIRKADSTRLILYAPKPRTRSCADGRRCGHRRRSGTGRRVESGLRRRALRRVRRPGTRRRLRQAWRHHRDQLPGEEGAYDEEPTSCSTTCWVTWWAASPCRFAENKAQGNLHRGVRRNDGDVAANNIAKGIANTPPPAACGWPASSGNSRKTDKGSRIDPEHWPNGWAPK